MSRNFYISLLLLNVAASIISIAWAIHSFDYEPLLAIIVSLAGLVSLYYNNPFKDSNARKQTIKNVNNKGTIIQAGKDVNQS